MKMQNGNAIALAIVLIPATHALAGSCPDGTTIRISVDEDPGGSATFASISDDGLIVAYSYDEQVYVLERLTGQTTNITTVGESYLPSLSGNGRYVAFASNGSYDPDYTSITFQYFLYDRMLGTYELLTLDTSGEPAAGTIFAAGAPSVSDDGRYIAFETRQTSLVTNPGINPGAVFVRDRQTGTTALISDTPDGCFSAGAARYPALSGDGRFVTFVGADDIVDEDANGFDDTFLHDTKDGETILVSVDTAGTQGNDDSSLGTAVSDDGRYIAFHTFADNFFPDAFLGASDVFLRDAVAETTTLVSKSLDGTTAQSGVNPRISPDGRYVAYISYGDDMSEDDTNEDWDVYVYDRLAATNELVSRNSDSDQQIFPGSIGIGINFYTLGLSADAQTVVWSSGAPNLVEPPTGNLFDLYLRRAQCPACAGDVHPPAGDGAVATTDLLALFGAWGSDDPTFDIAPPPDGDGIVDVVDFLLLLGAWGDCP